MNTLTSRNQTTVVTVGNLKIGGGNPVRVQSMTQTLTSDVEATVKQILELEQVGCEIIRVTVPDMNTAKLIGDIKRQIHIPLVVDIHFQHQLAIEAVNQGADKVRINPGNIGGEDNVRQVVKVCQEKHVPIRIGVNMGSLEKDLFAEYGKYGMARVMLESATRHIKIL